MSQEEVDYADIVPSPEVMDVILSSSLQGSDIVSLKEWLPQLRKYHIIILQTEAEVSGQRPGIPGKRDLESLQDFNVDILTPSDVKNLLGPRSACLSFNRSACRCIGWLLSKKKYILTLTSDCFPAVDPRTGNRINVLKQHTQNLITQSTPYYFNTLYDPFRASTDFVRGYPFSLRVGSPTAISHGLWLNVPDYDAPTQLVKPNERNGTYVDAVMTIPKGSLFPMSAMNLAFDRELIGVALYFPPLGDPHTVGLYDDMWAGWCAKVVCDHLGLGVKSGLPYVWREKGASAFISLKKEYRGIFWQEEIIPFFQQLQLSDDADTAEKCYIEIAKQVKDKLSKVDGYFGKLADMMMMWVELWLDVHAHNSDTPRSGVTNMSSFSMK